MSKLFNTHYYVTLSLSGIDNVVEVHQWNPYKEKLKKVRSAYISWDDLKFFGESVKNQLVKNGTCWLNDQNMDIVCSCFGWAKFEHFLGCQVCGGLQYVPMMSHYTGCHICNPKDRGSYTVFEISK